jgi:hypothetical protein
MEWIGGLNYLLGWKSLPLFGRFGYVEMIRCLTIKKCFSYAGHISVQFFAPFMVTSAPYGGSGPLYDGTWLENTVNFFIFEHG